MTAKMRHVAGGVIFIETDIDVRRQKYKRGSFSLPINCRKNKQEKDVIQYFFPLSLSGWLITQWRQLPLGKKKKHINREMNFILTSICGSVPEK